MSNMVEQNPNSFQDFHSGSLDILTTGELNPVALDAGESIVQGAEAILVEASESFVDGVDEIDAVVDPELKKEMEDQDTNIKLLGGPETYEGGLTYKSV